MIHRTALTALVGFLLAIGVTLGQTQITLHKIELDDPKAAFTHPMGFVFPAEVNGMPRETIRRHDDAGKDIGVDYDHSSPYIHATVYVYPGLTAGQTPKSHFKETVDFLASVDGAKLIKTEKPTIALGDKKVTGHRAIIAVTKPHHLAKNDDGITEFYIFPLTENWLLKFRITYRAEFKKEAAPIIEKFINGFAWPDKKSSSAK